MPPSREPQISTNETVAISKIRDKELGSPQISTKGIRNIRNQSNQKPVQFIGTKTQIKYLCNDAEATHEIKLEPGKLNMGNKNGLKIAEPVKPNKFPKTKTYFKKKPRKKSAECQKKYKYPDRPTTAKEGNR